MTCGSSGLPSIGSLKVINDHSNVRHLKVQHRPLEKNLLDSCISIQSQSTTSSSSSFNDVTWHVVVKDEEAQNGQGSHRWKFQPRREFFYLTISEIRWNFIDAFLGETHPVPKLVYSSVCQSSMSWGDVNKVGSIEKTVEWTSSTLWLGKLMIQLSNYCWFTSFLAVSTW